MKKYYLIPLVLLAIIVTSCQSKEEKAAELIKTELSKTLYDFDSYQPIETIVEEAKQTVYNDTACLNRANVLAATLDVMEEYVDKAEDAKKHMEIWGEPSYYSSSYSDSKYYEYKKEMESNTVASGFAFGVAKSLAKDLRKMISELDTTKIIGWEARHRFRCKTKGGHSTIGEYRYIIDKDFKEIIYHEDLDDKNIKKAREAIESLDAKFWEE